MRLDGIRHRVLPPSRAAAELRAVAVDVRHLGRVAPGDLVRRDTPSAAASSRRCSGLGVYRAAATASTTRRSSPVASASPAADSPRSAIHPATVLVWDMTAPCVRAIDHS